MGRYWEKMSVINVTELDNEFEKAKAGRKIWLSLSEKYNIDSDCGFIVFPVSNDELNKETIGLLPVYIERFHLKKIYVVTDQKSVTETIKGLLCQEVVDIELSRADMDNLLKYYRLVEFSAHIAVVSLEEPFGNDYLLKKKDMELKDYILSAIFKMR